MGHGVCMVYGACIGHSCEEEEVMCGCMWDFVRGEDMSSMGGTGAASAVLDKAQESRVSAPCLRGDVSLCLGCHQLLQVGEGDPQAAGEPQGSQRTWPVMHRR